MISASYSFGHAAFMHGFLLLGCIGACWLAGVGLIALWRAITGAPQGREDRTGWHQDNQGGAS